jgi:hypothetical protein
VPANRKREDFQKTGEIRITRSSREPIKKPLSYERQYFHFFSFRSLSTSSFLRRSGISSKTRSSSFLRKLKEFIEPGIYCLAVPLATRTGPPHHFVLQTPERNPYMGNFRGRSQFDRIALAGRILRRPYATRMRRLMPHHTKEVRGDPVLLVPSRILFCPHELSRTRPYETLSPPRVHPKYPALFFAKCLKLNRSPISTSIG